MQSWTLLRLIVMQSPHHRIHSGIMLILSPFCQGVHLLRVIKSQHGTRHAWARQVNALVFVFESGSAYGKAFPVHDRMSLPLSFLLGGTRCASAIAQGNEWLNSADLCMLQKLSFTHMFGCCCISRCHPCAPIFAQLCTVSVRQTM
jgi:hypothetical protein